MARESKGKSRSSKGAAQTAKQVGLALTALLFVAAIATTVFAYGRMEQRVGAIKSEPVKIVFEWPRITNAAAATGQDIDGNSTWMSEPYRHELLTISERNLSENPFDRASLEKTGEALLATGWIRKVKSISREQGGVVRIRAEWRSPAAVVRHADFDYLVSAEGEFLPLVYKHGGSGLKVIANPTYEPPSKFGESWIGGDVQAGLSLLAALQSQPAYTQVAGVDVGTYLKNRRLVILTDEGNRVIWGVPPGESNPSEPPMETKLGYLRHLMNSPDFSRRIDAGKPLIDLTNPRGIMIDVSAQPGAAGATPAEEPSPQAGSTIAETRPRVTLTAKRR